MVRVTCADCGAVIDSVEHPGFCPECGAGDRLIAVSDEGSLRVYEKVNVKKRRPGGRKPYEERTVGDDMHRASGRWNHLERIIDRDNDWYSEVITDQAGHVVHQTVEPLSRHRGHGSAKQAKRRGGP